MEDIVYENTTQGASSTFARIRSFAIASIAVVALAAAPTALAGTGLPGQYRTSIASPAQFKGTWVIRFTAARTYTVVDNGHVLVRGKYSTSGSKITFGHETGDGACAATGTYTWQRSGASLRFTRTHDAPSCAGRIGILAHRFTLVD
jgi:hypothetical protein